MNSEVLDQLYVRHFMSAFLYTFSLCNNRELAEDIVADAFVKAYLSFSGDHVSFRFWLLRVSKNLWIDYLRRQKRYVDDSADILIIADESTPEERLLRDERLSTLYRCIHLLPAQEHEVLVLHYFSNMPLREIARMFEATSGSIKTRIFRARQKLKKLMEDNGYDI